MSGMLRTCSGAATATRLSTCRRMASWEAPGPGSNPPGRTRTNQAQSCAFLRLAVERVLDRFRLLGRAVAKALQDGRLLDLPLSYAFYR